MAGQAARIHPNGECDDASPAENGETRRVDKARRVDYYILNPFSGGGRIV